MNRRLAIPAIGLIGVMAAMFGALTAPGAGAVTAHHLYVNPGASSNALTCGWHVACEPPISWGNALDWGNDPTFNKNVYWRSWGLKDSGGSGTMAYAYPYDASGSLCFGAGANVYDLGWTWRGQVVWLHTTLSGSAPTVYVSGGTSPLFTSAGPMGTTVGSEKHEDCPWDGAHLHQYSTASGWFANTAVYPNAPSTGTGYSLGAYGNWQNRTFWDY